MKSEFALNALGRAGGEEPISAGEAGFVTVIGQANKFRISDRWFLEDSFFEQVSQFLELGISAEQIKSVCQSYLPKFIEKRSNHGAVTAPVWERLFVEYLADLEERRTPVVADRLREFRHYLNLQNDLFRNANWLHRQDVVCASGEIEDRDFFEFVRRKVNQTFITKDKDDNPIKVIIKNQRELVRAEADGEVEQVCDVCNCEMSCREFDSLVGKAGFSFATLKLDEKVKLEKELERFNHKEVVSENQVMWSRWMRISAVMERNQI